MPPATELDNQEFNIRKEEYTESIEAHFTPVHEDDMGEGAVELVLLPSDGIDKELEKAHWEIVDLNDGENEIFVVKSTGTKLLLDNHGNIVVNLPVPIITKPLEAFLHNEGTENQQDVGGIIVNLINKLSGNHPDINLPEIKFAKTEENHIVFNWMIGSTLIGFHIEDTEQESTWFILIGEKDRVMRADGALDELDNAFFTSAFNVAVYRAYGEIGNDR